MGAGRTGERGAALLIVMVAVTVLTVLAADLAYEARVSLQIAANARNELQATYLAKSGVAVSRLVLAFQQQLDESVGSLAGTGGPTMPRPQLWQMAPVGSELTDALFSGSLRGRPETGPGMAGLVAGPTAPAGLAAAAPHAPGEGPAAPAGPASGKFSVDISDEGRKVNAQLDGLDTDLLPAQVQSLWQLVCDPRWDALFDREDANGIRTSRTDLLVNLRDWVDEDTTTSALAAAFAGCAVATPPKPFEPGFGDENFPYDRGEDRYRAKNARMDSLDELYLVSGIGDAFMAAFGDSLTVYLPRSAKRNVNETDPLRLVSLVRLVAKRQDDPKLLDAGFLQLLQRLLLLRTGAGAFALTPPEFGQIVAAAGVEVDEKVVNDNGPKGFLTGTSTVFRLRSVGRAGDVAKTLDVVMRAEKIQPNQPMPGKIVHWREE